MSVITKHPRRGSTLRKPKRPAFEPELRALRRRYALSQLLVSRLMDISLRTVSTAEAEKTVPQPLRRDFTELSRLCEAISEAMEAAFVGRWLDQPNEMLAGLKPIEAVERGKIDLVWQVIEGLRSGSQL